jgi:uncharacterized membrane protein YeaQ/YmgE (transglycosylase-associated protein family)
MSSDNIKRNNDCGLTILTIAGILGSIAATMIWSTFLLMIEEGGNYSRK